MLTRRISHVKNINVNTLVFTSAIQIGDSKFIDATNYAFALQREQELFFSNEAGFNDPVFTTPMEFMQIYEEVNMNIYEESPFIKVGCMNIGGVSSASIIHIGSCDDIRAHSKIKNTRELLEERHPEISVNAG